MKKIRTQLVTPNAAIDQGTITTLQATSIDASTALTAKGVSFSLAGVAFGDLSAKQYYCVRLREATGRVVLSNWVSGGLGILQAGAASGADATFKVIGQTQAIVSGHFNIGQALAVSEDGILTSSRVDKNHVIAYAMAAHASDVPSVISVFVNGPGVPASV